MTAKRLDRRRFLVGATVGFGGLAAACDRIAESSAGSSVLNAAESVTYRAQRMLLGANQLAREFTDSDITPNFKSNGTRNPSDKDYQLLAGGNFADWRLRVDGLVDKALDLSLSDLRALPSRTQITRHDCVEGWSCIGKWTGTPLSEVLARASVAALHRVGAMEKRDYAVVGGLMSYGISISDGYRQVGVYTGQVLKGAKPADLPIQQSIRFEFVINMKTAKALGVKISDNLLSLADEVIE